MGARVEQVSAVEHEALTGVASQYPDLACAIIWFLCVFSLCHSEDQEVPLEEDLWMLDLEVPVEFLQDFVFELKSLFQLEINGPFVCTDLEQGSYIRLDALLQF